MSDAPDNPKPQIDPRIRVRIRLGAGARGRFIVRELTRDGIEPPTAEEIVREELSSIRQKDALYVFGGAGLVIFGIVATAISYAEATRHSFGYHQYYIWWPPVLLGSVLAIVGISRLGKHKY